mmetsp:Transcript_46114/g.107881  ORF Transcript_46114/g.107881 Transcript_46114/m.107881 type:complete len:529 (+) Transcript_46114:79-1665(+)
MTWEAQLAGAISSLIFVILNCAMNIYTKWLFSPGGGNFALPWTMLAVQQAEAFLVLQPLLAWKDPSGNCGWAVRTSRHAAVEMTMSTPQEERLVEERQDERLGFKEMLQVLLVTGLFCLNVGLNSLSLVRISITLNQTVRAFLPVGVLLLATCIERKTYPSHSYCTTVFLVAGIALTCWGSPDFDVFGFSLALTSTLVAAAGSSLNGRLLSSGPFQGSGAVNIMRLMLLQSVPSCIAFTAIAVATEMPALMELLSQDDSASWVAILGLVSISSALALISNLGRCFLVASTSALMETFAGNTKVAALCIIDNRLFGTTMYGYNYFGVILTFLGFSVHILLQYLSGAKQEMKQSKAVKEQQAREAAQQGNDLESELERLKPVESPRLDDDDINVLSRLLPGSLNMARAISGGETGLLSENLALKWGRDHVRRRRGRRTTRNLEAIAEGQEEVPPLPRPRSRTWAAGEDGSSKSWIGDLNPVIEAPDWLNAETTATSISSGSTESGMASARPAASGLHRAASRNRFHSDVV